MALFRDHAFFLHALNAAPARRVADAGLFADLAQGQFRLLLDDPQYPPVDFVGPEKARLRMLRT